MISAALFGLASCGGGGSGGGGGAAPFAFASGDNPSTPTQPANPATPATPANGTGGSPGTAPPTEPVTTTPMSWKVTEVATGLDSPWSLAFLPDGKMLVSHRLGQLRLRNPDGSTYNGGADQVSGLPTVDAAGQGGLLDVAVDPAFASNRRIYFSFSEPDAGNPAFNGTAVARAELDIASRSLANLAVIYRQTPKVQGSSGHYGSRLVFDRSGYLFVTLGERQLDSQRGFAQDLTRGNGKVVRITTNGAPAPGNPSFGVAGAQPAIWSYGHRNPQGAALHPTTGELWMNEHGPQGGDEVNISLAGRNYGWPLFSYGQEYGTTTLVGPPTGAGIEPPITYWETLDGSPWVPGTQKAAIAPSGMAFYTADKLPDWKGNVFVGALAGTALWRLTLAGNTVASRERLLASRGERIRDVRQGPDGWLYVLTDGAGAKLLRIER